MNIARKFPIKTGLVLLLGFLVVSMWLISQYASKERQRDLMSWQSRIGILADTKAAAIEEYLNQQKQLLDELSANPTLQLYLAQFQQSAGEDEEILRAQLSHVRNLLRATASRLGFVSAHGGAVNTEYVPSSHQGLAIIDAAGQPVLSTRGFINDLSRYQALIDKVFASGKEQLIDIASLEGDPAFGFVMPIYPLQGLQSGKPQGAVLALFDPRQEIYRRLRNLHLDTRSDETLLVRQTAASLLYMSPLQEGFARFHQVPIDADLAANFAHDRIGDFGLKQDYRGRDVLVTGRNIDNTRWVLVQKIDASEALAESNKHQRFLLTSFSLLTLLIMALFIAVWRHSTSVRLQKITADLETHTALLHAVSDNINEHIFLVDENNHFAFANLSLANRLSIKPEDVIGKNMASVLGTDVAEQLRELVCEQDRGSLPCLVSLPLGSEQGNTYHVSTITLQQGEYINAKLYVLHDISRLRDAQEKRDRLARGIISTLVKAVDLHDPFCVDHSERTREVALGIAHELQLDAPRCEALELAAILANIGKLFIPREILVKMEPLSRTENDILKKHIDYAVDILKQLDFEGPVVEIIAQKNEYLDGSGYPRGISGEQILLESRILAVANAFVAMASSRAYREGRPIKEVVDILLQQADSHYDRHVLAALFHVAENKTDWHRWQVVNPPE
jgi:HD-GYP domain-containing protein (c-di-GMP phosphodiesterase class II)